MENSCKEAAHSRDPVTCRPTLDQLHGSSTQGKNSGRSTWKGRTLGGALRGSTPGEPGLETNKAHSGQNRGCRKQAWV